MRSRFSILKLMGLIVMFAVAFAALRGANNLWHGVVLSITLGLLTYAILASLLRRGVTRAGWLGFLVGCGGYFLAVRTLPEADRQALPTQRLLLAGQGWFVPGLVSNLTLGNFVVTTIGGSAGPNGSPAPMQTSIQPYVSSPGGTPFSQPAMFSTSTGALMSYPLDAPNESSYGAIGHALLSLILGFLVGRVGRWMVVAEETDRTNRDLISVVDEDQPPSV